MSMKQTFEDSRQMDIDLASGHQDEYQLGSAMDTSPSSTTMQDLPMELQEMILMEAIVSEVRDRKLYKAGWEKAADRVKERLRNVCTQWNHVLNTDVFRNRLRGLLDSFHQGVFQYNVIASQCFSGGIMVTTLDDEIFVLGHELLQDACIEVFDRKDLGTIERTIPLPGVTMPGWLAACNLKNCLYVLHQTSSNIEIWKVLIDGDESQVSPWITCSTQLFSRMSVSPDGSLVLFQGPVPSTITVYSADGALEHQMELANRVTYLHDIMPESSGNFLLVKMRSVVEVDREGRTLREYKRDQCFRCLYCALDLFDRMMMIDDGGCIRLLDSDFNTVKLDNWLHPCHGNKPFFRVHYNRKRNEFVAFESAAFNDRPTGFNQCIILLNITEENMTDDIQN